MTSVPKLRSKPKAKAVQGPLSLIQLNLLIQTDSLIPSIVQGLWLCTVQSSVEQSEDLAILLRALECPYLVLPFLLSLPLSLSLSALLVALFLPN